MNTVTDNSETIRNAEAKIDALEKENARYKEALQDLFIHYKNMAEDEDEGFLYEHLPVIKKVKAALATHAPQATESQE